MAVKTFTTMVQFQQMIEPLITKAVENTAKILQEKLVEIINNEYYEQFEPEQYVRTYEFLRSAVYKMIDPKTASIGIDENYFDYEYSAKYMMFENGGGTPRTVEGHWTGEDQVNMAARGYHGTYYIRTEGRFWETFIDYCNNNAVNILRKELAKQGIKTVK